MNEQELRKRFDLDDVPCCDSCHEDLAMDYIICFVAVDGELHECCCALAKAIREKL